MIKFTVLSTKGGVGKTTLAANLGALMADMGLRVLLVDADVQPALSKYFRLKREAPFGLTKVITSGYVTDDCISQTMIEGLDLIRSDDPDGSLQTWLLHRIDRGERLGNALNSPAASEDYYDCVLIDTQGTVGPLQDTSALAATQIISPIKPEILSAREFKTGTMELLARLEPTPNSKYRVGPVKAVISMQDRTADAKIIAESIRQDFLKLGGRVTVLETVVPDAKSYKESATLCIPAHRHEPSRRGVMPSAYETMHALLWELVPNLAGHYAGSRIEQNPDTDGTDA
jgi:chromosome partitioning related protein ParA